MPTPDETKDIAELERRILALEKELKGLPQSAATLEEGEARKRQAQQDMETFRHALKMVRGAVGERERVEKQQQAALEREERQQQVERKQEERAQQMALEREERLLASQRLQRQKLAYQESLLRDAEAWKGRALTTSEVSQVKLVARHRTRLGAAPGEELQIRGSFVNAWQKRSIPTFLEFTRAPPFIGPPVPTPVPTPIPAPPTAPPVPTDFVLDASQRLRLRQELVDLTEMESQPERVTDGMVDQVIASLRAVASQEGNLPLAGREMTVFLGSILGDIPLTRAQEEIAARYQQAMMETPAIEDLLLLAPPFNLDKPQEVIAAILSRLVRTLREQGMWDDALPVAETSLYLERAATDIFNEAQLRLLGTDFEGDTGAFWASALQGIGVKMQGIAEVGGINRALVAPPDVQRQVRQYIAAQGLTPQDVPSQEWLAQMEPIAAEVEQRVSQEQARLDVVGEGRVDTAAIVRDVVNARLMSEAQISQEQEERRLAGVDLRTRFDLVSQRPVPLQGEQPQDIDVLLTQAFERSERRFRLAKALGEKPDFEVIASEEVLRAQEHLAEVAPAAAAFFGPQPPGVGFVLPDEEHPLSEEDIVALQAFAEATGGPVNMSAVTGTGGFLSLTAGRAILRQRRREEAIAAERERRQEMVAEEEVMRREEGFAPFTSEEIASFLAGAIEAAPQEEPLTREQTLETPTGQLFFQATSVRFAREAAAAQAEQQRQQQEEERRLVLEERRVAAEERERQRREREAQPRGLGTSVR